MDESPCCCDRLGSGFRRVAMNLPIPGIAFKAAGLCVEAPNAEFGTAESQLKPVIAALERRLTTPPLGEQSGENQRIGRDSQQRCARSERSVGQARELAQGADAESARPDHGESENECRGSSKHRSAVRSQQR